MKKDKARNLIFMYMIAFLIGLIFYGPYALVYRASRGISLSQMFIIDAFFAAFIILFEVPWGYAADKIGYKKTIIISTAILCLSQVVFFQAYSVIAFIFSRLLLAIAGSGISGCDKALIYGCIDKEDSTKVFGRYSAMETLGFLVACIASTFIVKISLSATALWTIPPYFLAFVLSFFLIDIDYVKKEKSESLMTTLKHAISLKHLMVLSVFYAIFFNITHTIITFLNQVKYEQTGINIAYFGILAAVVQVVRILALKSHVVENKYSSNSFIIVLSSIIAVSIFVLAYVDNPILSIAMIIIISACSAMIVPVYSAMQNKRIKIGNRATVLSCYSMIENVFAIALYIIISYLTRVSLVFTLSSMGVLAIIGIFVFIKYIKLDKLDSKANLDVA